MLQTKTQKLKGLAPFVAVILSILTFFTITGQPERSQTWAMIKSAAAVKMSEGDKYVVEYISDSGRLVRKKGSVLLRDYDVELTTLITAGKMVLSSLLFFVYWLAMSMLLKILGMRLDAEEEQNEDERVLEAEELRQLTMAQVSQSKISFSGIPLPGKSDITNLIFCGAPGSGKSVNLREILSSIRRSGRKAVVFDPSGEMISHFYRNGKDIILNPLDERSASWDVWCDCLRYNDYLQVANTLIADQPQHKDWITGARIVLARLTEIEGREEIPDSKRLVDAVRHLNDEKITEILKTTEAAPIIVEFGEKAFFGIRGVLLASLQSLIEMEHSNFRFSVRRWAFNEANDDWLFISSHASEMEITKPLTATWINLAAKTLMELNSDHLRRVFLVIDDIHATNKIPSLANFMVQSRRTGASAIFTAYSIGLLTNTYGEEDTNTLLRACDNVAAMNNNELSTQQWLSSRLGTKDTVETTEVSYGNHGQKTHTQRILKLPLVSAEDIGKLPNMHGYVRFGSEYPTARFHSADREMAVVAPAFVPRSDGFLKSNNEIQPKSEQKKKTVKEGNVDSNDLEALNMLNTPTPA